MGEINTADSPSGGLSSLFQNKLFLQYLAGFGADLSAAGADTSKGFQPTNVNAITQQNIQTQNAAKAMPKFLQMIKEALNPGSDASLNLSKKGVTAIYPGDSEMAKSFLGGEEYSLEGIPSLSMDSKIGKAPGGATTTNPFDSGQIDFSPSDLAGLTPQDLSSALSGALNIQGMVTQGKQYEEDLKDKRVQASFDRMYKGKQIEDIESQIKHRETPKLDPLDQPFAINALNKKGGTSLREWNSLTESEKNYQLYLYGSKKALDEGEPLTRQEFKNLDPPEQIKLFEYFKTHPKTYKLAKEYKQAGATQINIGEAVKKQEALDQLKSRQYFKSGEMNKDLNKYLEGDEVQRTLNAVRGKAGSEEYKQGRSRELVNIKAKFAVESITSRGGTILSSRWDKDKVTAVWKVQWSDGKTEEVKARLK
jgi:hypothetical protein